MRPRKVEHYPITLKGGPRDGQTLTLSWELFKRGRLEVAVQRRGENTVRFRSPSLSSPAYLRAFYVPCPTEPDKVWRLDSQQSDVGVALSSPEVCHVPAVGKEGTFLGIPVIVAEIETVYKALDEHYAEFGRSPDRFEFDDGAVLPFDKGLFS